MVYEAFVLQAEEPDKSLASNINVRSSNRLNLKDLGINAVRMATSGCDFWHHVAVVPRGIGFQVIDKHESRFLQSGHGVSFRRG
jgi:hypothetical protein